MLAYGLGKGQMSVSNPLDTAMNNRYDVAAKLPAGATKEQIALMPRRLLADRFKVAQKTNLKEVTDSGVESGCTRSFAAAPGASLSADCHRMTSADLAQAITVLAPGYFDRPAVDLTGLTGLYDFTLEWITRAESMNGNPGPAIFRAVEQLGLKLEPRKQAMDIVMMDHAEKAPTDN